MILKITSRVLRYFMVSLHVELIVTFAIISLNRPAHSLNPWWSTVAQLAFHANTADDSTSDTGELTRADFGLDPSSSASGFDSPTNVPFCYQLQGLTVGQRRICELYPDHMPAVGLGAYEAIHVCQTVFKNDTWNCSSFKTPFKAPVHHDGTKEAAYTYAITAAGVAHQIARACKLQKLQVCDCGTFGRPENLHDKFDWGGCSDNIEYGYKFAEGFTDVREKEKRHAKNTKDFAQALVNRWNNDAGRRVTTKLTKIKCKCVGISGGCTMQSCFYQLPDLLEVGSELKRKYYYAIHVKLSQRGNLQVRRNQPIRRRLRDSPSSENEFAEYQQPAVIPERDELLYLDESPNYCSANETLAIPGTRGRTCNPSHMGDGSCHRLCCNRGHTSQLVETIEKCNCRFEWCCEIKCDTCRKSENLSFCN